MDRTNGYDGGGWTGACRTRLYSWFCYLCGGHLRDHHTMTELPDGATLLRDIGELDQHSVPDGLLQDHSLKQGIWGRLEVLSGALDFVWQTEGRGDQSLKAGDVVIIPPEELHHLQADAEFRLRLALYKASSQV